MTGKLYEMAWPPDKSSIVPIDKNRVWRRKDGYLVAHVTHGEMENIVRLMDDLGLKDMALANTSVLSVRTTTWLVRLESGGDVLFVRRDGCTIDDVLLELKRSPELEGESYFVYPVVVGKFQVNVAVGGFLIPTDRRIVNEKSQIVIDPDVGVEDVRPEVREGF